MKLRTITLLVLVCAVALAMPAMAKNQKAGKWSMTIETEMEGMPMKMPPMTVSTCVTKEQAESNEPPKGQRENASDCRILDLKMDGDTASWKMECPKEKMTGEGTATYKGDSFDMKQKVTVQDQHVTTHMTGKYIGPCDK
jgi:uncharacterized protein YggE